MNHKWKITRQQGYRRTACYIRCENCGAIIKEFGSSLSVRMYILKKYYNNGECGRIIAKRVAKRLQGEKDEA